MTDATTERDTAILDALPEILAFCRKSGNVVGLVKWLRSTPASRSPTASPQQPTEPLDDGFPTLSPNPEETDRPGTWDDDEVADQDFLKLVDDVQRTAQRLMGDSVTILPLDEITKRVQANDAARSSIEAAFVALSERLEIESRRVEEWIEREAKLCPEDFGIEEYVHSLEKQLSALSEERDRLRAELMHLKLESARERVAPLVEEAKLAASKERRP